MLTVVSGIVGALGTLPQILATKLVELPGKYLYNPSCFSVRCNRIAQKKTVEICYHFTISVRTIL